MNPMLNPLAMIQPGPPKPMMDASIRQGGNPMLDWMSTGGPQPQPQSNKLGRANPLANAVPTMTGQAPMQGKSNPLASAMPGMDSAPVAQQGASGMPYGMVGGQPQQGNPLGAAFGSFARGFLGPERTGQLDAAHAARGNEKLTKTLAWLQQTAQQPAEQRAAFTQRFAQQIAADTGQPVEAIMASINDPSGFSDQSIQQGIATLSAQLGQAPAAPEYMNLGGGNVGMMRNGQFSMVREAPQEAKPTWEEVNGRIIDVNDPTKVLADYSDQEPDQPEYTYENFDGAVWAVDKRDPTKRTRLGAAPQGSQASQDTYRPATPQELDAWGIPADTPVKINNRTGEPQVISGAKPASEYTPAQQSKFIQQAQTLDAVEGAINAYVNLIETNNPQLWTTGLGGDNPVAKQLDAARTAILIQAKELFNLGVLNGPDLEIISSAVPGVTGFDAMGKSAASVKQQLGVLSDYITRGRNQIPPELLAKARPQGSAQGVSSPQPAPAGNMAQTMMGVVGDMIDVPAGVDPNDWQFMTPEERALFQ